ncbi:MAG: WD40/YVTN/BNR-like repeat-containing protein [Gemmatimonadota bacterium]
MRTTSLRTIRSTVPPAATFTASALTALAVGALAAFAAPTPAAAQQEADPNHVFSPTLYEDLDWRFAGPYRGGRSTAVAGHAEHPHTFFQGAVGGGVWSTNDNGQTWSNICDEFFDVAPVGAVAVAPSDPNVIYVGTGSACIRGNVLIGEGVYKSTDGGKTWRFVGLPEAGQIGSIVVHPRDEDLVYLAALGNPFGKNEERGVYRSEDGGETWENILFANDSTGAVDLAMNPHNPREIYAGMWRAQRKPWTMISGGPEGGVYKTTDGGDNWEKLGGGLPEGVVGKVGVTVSGGDPDRVWAIIEHEPDGGVYRSDDAGESWQRVNSNNNLRQRAWYYTHVVADPQDENTVYVLNVGMWRSVDGGESFEQISVPHGDVHDLWIHPDDPDHMVVANDGGAQVSVNGGESWSTYYNQPTAELYDVVVDHGIPYRLYGAQQDNDAISVMSRITSSVIHPKAAWRFAVGCETGPIGLDPDRPQMTWGGCYGGAINRMDMETGYRRNVIAYPQLQLGQAMSDMEHRFQWVSPIVVSPHDPDVVYHASQYVNRTTDGGMSWERISPDLSTNNPEHQEPAGGPINHDITGVEVYGVVFSLMVSPHDPDVLWAGSDDGLMHITRDGGGSWTEITPDDMPELGTVDEIDVSPHSPGTAYIAVHKYRLDDFMPYIFRTENYGEDWELLTDGGNGIPEGHFVRTVREDPEREGLLYAGTERGVYVSFDDGGHWQPLRNDMPVTPITGMKVHRSGDLVVSTMGRGFWILDGLDPLRELDESVASAPAHLFDPADATRWHDRGGAGGPFAPENEPYGALIDYWLADDAGTELTLEIVDAGGATVRTFTSDTARHDSPGFDEADAGAGHHRVVWDLTYPGPDDPDDVQIWGFSGGVKAPPGRYLARLSVDGTTLEREFEVLADPRLEGTIAQADYEEQLRVGMAVRDSLDAVWRGVRTARAVQEQVESIEERLREAGMDEARISAQADSLARALTGVETRMTQVRSESGQDPIRFPGQIDNQYAELYGNVTGWDGYISGGAEGRPTEGARRRFQDLNAEWAEISAELERILDEEVAGFNALLMELGIPAIILPPEEEPRVIS